MSHRLGYWLGYIFEFDQWLVGVAPLGRGIIVTSSMLVTPLFDTFPLRPHFPVFQMCYFFFVIIPVFASSSCFTLALLIIEISCVGDMPRA